MCKLHNHQLISVTNVSLGAGQSKHRLFCAYFYNENIVLTLRLRTSTTILDTLTSSSFPEGLTYRLISGDENYPKEKKYQGNTMILFGITHTTRLMKCPSK